MFNKRELQLIFYPFFFVLTTLLAGHIAANEVFPVCEAPAPATAVCAINPPEDLVLTPDGKHLLMSITPGLDGRHQSRLMIMDIDKHQQQELVLRYESELGWGDKQCARPTQPPTAHGIHLSKRSDGRYRLLVVNHQDRESIEEIELVKQANSWEGVWRGCVENRGLARFNDVAGMPDGGWVATVMFESSSMKPPLPLEQLLDGRDTGYLMRWSADKGMHKLPNSYAPFPNGVQVSADGSEIWFAAWTASGIWQYDLQNQRLGTKIDVGYYVDNLNWSDNGGLLGAGITDLEAFQDCFRERRGNCTLGGFRVSTLNPATGNLQPLYGAEAGVLDGASVALQVGSRLYIGAFDGDRLLYLDILSAQPELRGIDKYSIMR